MIRMWERTSLTCILLGTGYYYSRYRPGLISVLVFLVSLTSGLQLFVQQYNYWMDTKRIERFVKKARKLAWGPDMKPQAGAKKVRLLLTERPGDDRSVEMLVEGENVYLVRTKLQFHFYLIR